MKKINFKAKRLKISKRCIVLILTFLAFVFSLQGQHNLTLKKQTLLLAPLKFNVVAVVDGRKVKSLGVMHDIGSKKYALPEFKSDAATEIMDLITRSNINSNQPPDMVLRIETLTINEVTERGGRLKNAIAELTMDFFFKFEDDLYFIDRKYATQRTKGELLKEHHPANITTTIAMVLQSINSYDLQNHIIEEPPIHLDQVKAFEPKTTVESLPILQARDYPDGIYQNFTEFKENRTTIWDGYEVDDSRELKLDWADSLGEDYKPPIYAIAYHNQLYYHYNNNFYPIEKRGNTFIFFGPERSNPHQVVRDWFWGGVVVAAVGTASQNLRLVYEIDLHTGGIRELGYSRR